MTEVPSSDRCGNCRFWLRGKYSAGNCRRRPPTVLGSYESADTYWPKTEADDWCGEYEKAPEPQP